MKKLLIISNLVWGIFFYMGCSPITQINTKKCDWFCYNYTGQPLGGLSYGAATQMAVNYRNSLPNPVTDERSIWFSLDTLKKFIWQIEHNTCKVQCSKNTITSLGVRIYYGRYPTAASTYFTNIPASYAGRHTIFMVPTFNKGANHYDFDPLHQSNCLTSIQDQYAPTPERPKPTQSMMSRSMMLLGGFSDGTNGMQNHGCLGPPDCSEGAAFLGPH